MPAHHVMTATLRRLCAAAVVGSSFLTAVGSAMALEGLPAAVRVETSDNLGEVYADARGRTLYTFQGDKIGVSTCNADRYHEITGAGQVTYFLPDHKTRPTCQEIWAPFTAAADSAPVGEWSVITRKDQSKQWAFQGKPLYTFIGDTRPGEINATGPGRYIAGRAPLLAPSNTPPGIVGQATVVGRVLMTGAGRALYESKSESAGKVTCHTDCLRTWDPLLAPALAADNVFKGWSIVHRPDGVRQWAFRGKPLYMYRGDVKFGELNGADEPGWSLASLQVPIKPPAGIRTEMTAAGPVLADENGKTLYLWNCVDEAPDRGICDIPASPGVSHWRSLCGPSEVCAATWRPIAAPAGAKPVGTTWSVVAIDASGSRQYAAPGDPKAVTVWAYRGRPVYTYVGDKAPGDMAGHSFRASGYWGFRKLPAGEAGNDRF